MHRDKKLGLALGVLLIGIVGALFFRLDKKTGSATPKLGNPQALDDRIAETDGPKPYFEPTRKPVRLGTIEEAGKPDQINSGIFTQRSAPEPFNTSKPHGHPRTSNKIARNIVPDPIPLWPDRPAKSNRFRAPRHNRAWKVASPKRTKTTQASRRAVKSALRIHSVRQRDTLTGLAARYLGSSARFLEIFEANRDILKNPDDLRVGMRLRIPSARSVKRKARPGATPAHNISSRKIEEDELDDAFDDEPSIPSIKKTTARRFIPARRAPMILKRANARSARRSNRRKPKRTLSQLPPINLPPID